MNTYLFLILFFINCSSYNSAKVPDEYEIAPWHGWKQGAITYSFDDGCLGQLTSAIPSLDKYEFKATFNLVTQWVTDWSGWKQAAQEGHEIASHTVTHPNLNDAGESELSESKEIIEKNIGQECVTIVYPYCVLGDKKAISRYYISGRTCDGQFISSNPKDMFDISSMVIGDTTQNNNVMALNNLADTAVRQNKWVVFLIHGIDDDGGYSPISSKDLDQHFSYVKQQDNLWVATFKDVSKYILEANNLVITESGKEGSYIVDVSCTHQTSITKLDVPVTISRKAICTNPQVKENGSPITSSSQNGKVIFDVVPGNKYTIQCS